jgi:hypothetical protein
LQAWTTAGLGQHATVTLDATAANNGDYVYNGSSWDYTGYATATITPATGWASAAAPNVARLVMQGKMVTLYGSLTWVGGGAYSTMFTVPTPFRPPTTGIRNVGKFEQITGAALNFGHAIYTGSTGVFGNGTGVTTSLPGSGAVFLDGISWWMD